MRIFLTGATGFIGSRIAQRLRERGDAVIHNGTDYRVGIPKREQPAKARSELGYAPRGLREGLRQTLAA